MSSAVDRKRRERARQAAGIVMLPHLPVSEDFADMAVLVGLITEAEAARPEGLGRAVGMVLDSWMREQQAAREVAASPLPAWFVYSRFGEPLTLPEKQAWLQQQNLLGATRDLVAARIREHGLEARWFGHRRPPR